jgi:hypothetical protein
MVLNRNYEISWETRTIFDMQVAGIRDDILFIENVIADINHSPTPMLAMFQMYSFQFQ